MDEMMLKGVELMFAGMGVVFTFLVLMIIVMTLSAKVCKKFEKPVDASADAGGAGSDQLAQVAVAIAAAKRHIQS